MQTKKQRFTASLVLTPAVLLLLVWIGRFPGSEEVARMGLVPFLLWALATSIVIAYCVTLYIAYVFDRSS